MRLVNVVLLLSNSSVSPTTCSNSGTVSLIAAARSPAGSFEDLDFDFGERKGIWLEGVAEEPTRTEQKAFRQGLRTEMLKLGGRGTSR
jgi:hypothetical protein